MGKLDNHINALLHAIAKANAQLMLLLFIVNDCGIKIAFGTFMKAYRHGKTRHR